MNILNIKNQDIEEIIRDSIKEVKEKLKGLDYNQTCLIYSSALFEILKRKFKTFPNVYEIKLQDAKEDIVDRIAENIFDIDKVEDLNKYLQ